MVMVVLHGAHKSLVDSLTVWVGVGYQRHIIDRNLEGARSVVRSDGQQTTQQSVRAQEYIDLRSCVIGPQAIPVLPGAVAVEPRVRAA